LLVDRLRARGRSLPPEAAIAIALKIVDALAYAHDLKNELGEPLDIVHRDISPRNVLIDYAGEVKIIDFGVARGKLDQFRTAPGVIVGSIEYMSPEQAAALPVDRRSDIYSVGVVLYEMLTGRHLVPREGLLAESLNAVVREVPPPISSIAPHLPAALDEVLARALAKDASQRYATCGELHADLAEAAVGIVLTPAPILGMLMREVLLDEEQKMLDLIERSKRAVELADTRERTRDAREASEPPPASYEPTALVDRPRGNAGRGRKISVTAADEAPFVGTGIGGMVIDMPGDAMPPGRTSYETLRKRNKRLFYSLVALSAVAVLLVGAVIFTTRGPDVTRTEDQVDLGPATPGVVSRVSAKAQPEEQVVEVVEPSLPAPRVKSEPARVRKTKVVEQRGGESAPPGEQAKEAAKEQPRDVAKEQPKDEAKEEQKEQLRESRAPYPELRKMFSLLRKSESKEPNTYYRLLGGIETAMADLPPAAQRRIQAELNAATLTYDVDALGRALEELMKARAQAS
jgi:serine/threonine-protein kinase